MCGRIRTVTQGASALLPLAVAGLLAGCNSREGQYSQGPWGPPDVRRNYPQYSSPWSPRFTNERPLIVSGVGYATEEISPVVPAGASVGLHRHHEDSRLPADPHQPAPVAASVQADSNQPEQLALPGERQPQVATEASPAQASPAAESPPGVFSAPRRASSYAGTWKATDSMGGTCLIHLSSVATLDLYRASASKCSSEALRNVNLWRFEANRISLFSRTVEIARLEGSEASLTGSLNKSGTSLKMLR